MAGNTENQPSSASAIKPGAVLITETGVGAFAQNMLAGRHQLLADEPLAAGGNDLGPGPYELLSMALGACTSMTLRLYARRKQIPLEHIVVRLAHSKIYIDDCADCDAKSVMLDHIDREIELIGPLDDSQLAKLMEIADKCPVHRTLTQKVRISSRLRR